MNKRQATAIRSAHLRGEPVKAVELQEAINVLGTKRSNKMRLPPLREEIRQRVNAVLLLHVGIALGEMRRAE
jgi:hypothetical protein